MEDSIHWLGLDGHRVKRELHCLELVGDLPLPTEDEVDMGFLVLLIGYEQLGID